MPKEIILDSTNHSQDDDDVNHGYFLVNGAQFNDEGTTPDEDNQAITTVLEKILEIFCVDEDDLDIMDMLTEIEDVFPVRFQQGRVKITQIDNNYKVELIPPLVCGKFTLESHSDTGELESCVSIDVYADMSDDDGIKCYVDEKGSIPVSSLNIELFPVEIVREIVKVNGAQYDCNTKEIITRDSEGNILS